MPEFQVYIAEGSLSHNPDGAINYKQVNGDVLDAASNSIGTLNLMVKADVEMPLPGLSYKLEFNEPLAITEYKEQAVLRAVATEPEPEPEPTPEPEPVPPSEA